jgi:DNA-binding MarR family transcriptional regulator
VTGTPSEAPTRALPSQVAALQEASLLLTRRIRKLSHTELTLSQMSALSTLQRHGSMRVGDLANREQISKSSMTKLIAKLEEMGYLGREVDPEDGRSFRVTITEHGHALLADSRQRANEFLAGEIERLDEQHRVALLDALPALQALVHPTH